MKLCDSGRQRGSSDRDGSRNIHPRRVGVNSGTDRLGRRRRKQLVKLLELRVRRRDRRGALENVVRIAEVGDIQSTGAVRVGRAAVRLDEIASIVRLWV